MIYDMSLFIVESVRVWLCDKESIEINHISMLLTVCVCVCLSVCLCVWPQFKMATAQDIYDSFSHTNDLFISMID